MSEAPILAWFYQCWKPGKSQQYASVDPDDNQWWGEGWKVVTRTPLIRGGSEITVGKDNAPVATSDGEPEP